MYSNNSDSALTGFLAGRADSNNCCNTGNGMWGGGWDGLWGIIILAMIFGWGNGGWGNGFGGGNNAAGFIPYAVGNSYTDASLQRGFDTQNIIGKLDGINNGLCDGFYAMNTGMLNGFNSIGNAICDAQYATQQGFNATQVAMMQGFNAIQSQASDCCCKTQTAIGGVQNAITGLGCSLGREIERGFCDVGYNQATNTTAIIQNAHNDTDRVLAKLDAMEMSRKDETIASLREKLTQANFAASQAAQNAFIQANQDAQTAEILRRTGHDCPTAAYVVQPPMPVTFPTNCCGSFSGYGYGYNNSGCGCNTGCNSCGC